MVRRPIGNRDFRPKRCFVSRQVRTNEDLEHGGGEIVGTFAPRIPNEGVGLVLGDQEEDHGEVLFGGVHLKGQEKSARV